MEHMLDLRDLPPPEPLERILDALADLPAGDCLRVRLPMEPMLLYPMLRTMGMRWVREACEGDEVVLLISELPG